MSHSFHYNLKQRISDNLWPLQCSTLLLGGGPRQETTRAGGLSGQVFIRSLSGLGLGHCQFRSLSGQVRSLTGLYRVSSGSRWPTATNLCWLDKAGLSRSQETPAHQPQLSLNWAGQVVKYYEIFSKYFTTWNIFRHELRQCVRLSRDILSQAGFDEFRGPEISPGQNVQTDEQIDAFVRSVVLYFRL